MSPDRRPPGPQLVIKERISPRAIDALMRNYRDPQLAFLDLVDNAVDNRIEGKPLAIRIRVTKEELSVSNHGGEGLDFDGLESYFTWGHSEKTSGQIGQFGVGGKAAMGFLGKGMEIVCSANGSDAEYRVSDTSWESRREGELKEYIPEEQKATSPEGYFKVRIIDLKSEISAAALATKLGDIYRPLIMDGSIKVTVNGKPVDPLQIRYLEEEGTTPETLRVQTRYGDWFILKVGVLAQGQRVKPGIRCYYRGRLIEDEQFFGQPTPSQLPGSSRLIGEADLDRVPVTPNKSNFIRGSVEWEMASRTIHTALSPWMDKLANLKNLEQSKVERYEKELARSAKRVLEHVLANTQLVTKAHLPGESSGRLPPNPRDEIADPPVSTRPTTKPREGRTPPLLPARGEVKRWGAMHDVEPVSMGNPDTRAEVIEERGRRILRINSDYPLYQTAKRISNDAQEVYMAETLVMELVASISEGKTVKEYVGLVNELLKGCGEIFKQRIRGKKTPNGHQ